MQFNTMARRGGDSSGRVWSFASFEFDESSRELRVGGIYGIQWGDPDVWTPLQFIRDRYVRPFVKPEHTALDIGCNAGFYSFDIPVAHQTVATRVRSVTIAATRGPVRFDRS